eukprot:8274759-Alexandrium_andersonii.AAC.1
MGGGTTRAARARARLEDARRRLAPLSSLTMHVTRPRAQGGGDRAPSHSFHGGRGCTSQQRIRR